MPRGVLAVGSAVICHILENNLSEPLGHFLNSTAGLKRALERRNVDVRVYTHVDATKDILDQLAGRAVFHYRSWDGNKSRDGTRSVERLGADFAASCAAIDNPQTDDLILVPTAQQDQVYGLALYLEGLPLGRRPRVIILVHWSSWDTPDRLQDWRIATRRLVNAAGEDRALVAASCEEMADALAEVLGRPVARFPLPLDYGPAPPPEAAPGSGRPIVAILGRSLPRKGSRMLPSIILAARIRAPRLRFFVQVTKEMRAMTLLRFIPGVEVHEGPLSSPDYLQRIAAADIVLMPYRRGDYAGRTSGIFAECAALGRVAVVPAGTWLATQLAREHAAGVAFESAGAQAIARALLRAAQDLPDLSRNARARADYWWRHESVSAFADRLLAFA